MGSQGTPNLPPSSLSAAESPVTYTDVSAMQDAMAPLMERHTAQLQQAVQEFKGQLHQLTNKVTANDCRLGETFQDVSTLNERFDTLQKSHEQLCNKVDDRENRSRRCNIRVIGITESVKGPDLFKVLQETLPELLQVWDVCSNMVVERAHRLGPTRPAPESRPRVVIFKVLYTMRQFGRLYVNLKTYAGTAHSYLFSRITLQKLRVPAKSSPPFAAD